MTSARYIVLSCDASQRSQKLGDVAVLADCTDRIHSCKRESISALPSLIIKTNLIFHAASYFLCGLTIDSRGGPLRQRYVLKSIQLRRASTPQLHRKQRRVHLFFEDLLQRFHESLLFRKNQFYLFIKICPVCVRISCTPIRLRRYLR